MLNGILREPTSPEDKLSLAKKSCSRSSSGVTTSDGIASRGVHEGPLRTRRALVARGGPGTLKRIAREDLVEFHRRWLVPGRLILGVGRLREQRCSRRSPDSRALGGPPGSPPLPWTPRPGRSSATRTADVNQSNIEIGHFGIVQAQDGLSRAAGREQHPGRGGFPRASCRTCATTGPLLRIYSYFTAEPPTRRVPRGPGDQERGHREGDSRGDR